MEQNCDPVRQISRHTLARQKSLSRKYIYVYMHRDMFNLHYLSVDSIYTYLCNNMLK